jgi:peptidoglycan-associated lipoprotein
MRFKNCLPLLTLAVLLACKTAPKAQTTTVVTTPVVVTKPSFVTWDKKMVELGKVKKGEKRTLFFEFTNTSGQDIKIDIVDACECTKVDFPRSTIAPNGKGRLDVVFDSTDKDADETIGITIVFENLDKNGNPVIESIEYKFELVK